MSFRSTLPSGNISRCLAIDKTLINPNFPWITTNGSLVIQKCNFSDPTQKFIFNLSSLSISSFSNPSLCLNKDWDRTDGIYWMECTYLGTSDQFNQYWLLSRTDAFCRLKSDAITSQQLRICNAKSLSQVSSM
jgi:hypothetical protein